MVYFDVRLEMTDHVASELRENLLAAFVLVFLVYICLYILPKKRRSILENQYPEMKFYE